MACEPSTEDLDYYRKLNDLQLCILQLLIQIAVKKDPEGEASRSIELATKALAQLKELTEENFARLAKPQLPKPMRVV